MDNAPSYFLPPFEGDWRVVQLEESPHRIRIEWLQEDSLATDWEISLISVTQVRSRQGPPDPDEAHEAGLLPGLTNGAATAQIHQETAQQALFVCNWTGDFAKSDQTLAVRMRVDGCFLVGIACRMRPPLEGGAAGALLERLHAAGIAHEAPEWYPLDPTRDARFGPQIEPYVRGIEQAMTHDDYVEVLQLAEALRPALELSPMSRFALHVHAVEGWAHMRSAFAGVAAGSSRAIEQLRRTLDNFEPAQHPDLYRAAASWLADAYARRDQSGDLQQALAGYQSSIALDDAEAHPGRVARLHLRMGIIRHHLARESSAKQTEHLQLALPDLERAGVLYGAAQDLAGQAEAAVARADAVRLLGRGTRLDADQLYAVAARLLQQPELEEALGADRYHLMVEHVRTSIRVRDARQLNARAPAPDVGKARAVAAFVRPFTPRPILVQPPNGDPRLALDRALRRALQPDVAMVPVDSWSLLERQGAVHGGVSTAAADLLRQSHIVVLVPGFAGGLDAELKDLILHGLLTKTLMVMTPAGSGQPLQDGWEHLRAEAFELGLDLPPYTPAGALLRSNRDGSVVRRVPLDVLFEPKRLLQWLDDLLNPPPPPPPDADSGRRLSELMDKGLLRRTRRSQAS
jgi:tetratricopeptide (TPR) repeat protein